MLEVAKESKEKRIGGVNKWEAENACDTILRAEEIKLEPKLFNAAKIVMQRRYDAIQKVKGQIGNKANSK